MAVARALEPMTGDFTALKLDAGQLAIGKLVLKTAKGIFQDGTPFYLGDDDTLPLPLDIGAGVANETVYLALPLYRLDARKSIAKFSVDGLARYRVSQSRVRDNNAGFDGIYPVEIGSFRPRLMLESRNGPDIYVLASPALLKCRADKTVVLDDKYIPAVLQSAASAILSGFLRELQGLLHTRGEALAARVAGASQGAGVAEVADFMLLQTINRYEPLLEHLARDAQPASGKSCIGLCLQLMGDLATFYRQSKRPMAVPDYRHDDLRSCFIACH